MKKDEKIRRIIILIGSIMTIIGGFMMLTRGNPLDSVIGKVIITNGRERMQIDGYKYSYNKNDKSDSIETFIPITDAESIPEMDYVPDSEDHIAVSYSEKSYTGNLNYTVYDSDFNILIDNQPNLVMPGEKGKKYNIEVSVNWGESESSVTVKYYFAINIIGE